MDSDLKIISSCIRPKNSKTLLDIDATRLECPYIKTETMLGKGALGQVFRACCGKDCKYVVKILPSTEGNVQQEVLMQQRFAKAGLAKPVYEAFYCEEPAKSYVISEPLSQTLNERLEDIKKGAKGRGLDPEIVAPLAAEVQKAVNLLVLAHSYGLIHGDAHLENFMYDSAGQLFFIDFGLSQYEPNMFDNDPEQMLEDLGSEEGSRGNYLADMFKLLASLSGDSDDAYAYRFRPLLRLPEKYEMLLDYV